METSRNIRRNRKKTGGGLRRERIRPRLPAPAGPRRSLDSGGATAATLTGTGLDSPQLASAIPIAELRRAGARANRTPILLFWLSGLLLLRYAERQLYALLFQ